MDNDNATSRRLWQKPWGFPEGFAIGMGLIVTGIVLQLSAGGIEWSLFVWPANIIVLGGLVVVVVTMHMARRRVYAFRFLTTLHAAIPTLLCVVVLTVVMGLTRQTVNGTWFNNMLAFWPFVLIYTYMVLILGMVVLRSAFTLFTPKSSSSLPGRLAAQFFHLGLFTAITCGTLGNADMQRLKMVTTYGAPEWRAIDTGQNVVELDLAVELKRFVMEQYDDGSPKRFASLVQVVTKSGQNFMGTVEVNKPVEVEGWKLYQYGYDQERGPMSQISILELVKDPWLPWVYVGIYMMIGGALLMFATKRRRTALATQPENNEKTT